MRVRLPARGPARRPAAAVIEFAVVVPVLLMFVLGIIEYGRMLMVAQVTTNGSREGARYAVQADTTPNGVDTYVRNYLKSASIPDAAISTVAIEYQLADGSWATASGTTSLSTLSQGTSVRVRVEIDFTKVSWLPSTVFVPSGTLLKGTTVMRKE
jgi:Flp pilus assembly protein TadG